MKMKTITIKCQNYNVAADATIAAPGWVCGIYYRAGKNWYFTDVGNKEVLLLGDLPRGPLGANLSESAYIGVGQKRKLNKVVIFNLAGLVISLALLVSVIAVIAIDVIGA